MIDYVKSILAKAGWFAASGRSAHTRGRPGGWLIDSSEQALLGQLNLVRNGHQKKSRGLRNKSQAEEKDQRLGARSELQSRDFLLERCRLTCHWLGLQITKSRGG